MTLKKVIIGLSGGVDSSVAAALLIDQGYEVIGVSLNLLTCTRPIDRSCCSAKDREDARAVCEQLGIEHYVVDCRSIFKEAVINQFVGEYIKGRTPSPCILCNERVKFPALIEEANRRGADYVATGHYAQIVKDDGKFKLCRATNKSKDQSYFLFRMRQEDLARTLFPLGHLDKVLVREIAKSKGLKVHEKVDSQEVCFVSDNDYTCFVEASAGLAIKGPGNFVSLDGKILGRHDGFHSYTVGQRRGLGFGVGKRQYVVKIDPARNEVVLGGPDDLLCSEMTVQNVSWVYETLCANRETTVRIRSTHAGEVAELIDLKNGDVLVKFDRPVRAVAPGQAAVFYQGDEVLGGGWIA